jgi:hypothetical protein
MVLVAACASTSSVQTQPTNTFAVPTTLRMRSTTTSRPVRPPPIRQTVPPISQADPAQPGWVPISADRSGVALDERTVTAPDGHSILVTRFRFGAVSFNLHVGSNDPPTSSAIRSTSGPVVTASERPLLLAAFNGGFKLSAGVGGFVVNQSVLAPLVLGRASFVIDTNGIAHVGIWGRGLPLPQEHVASVRQDLAPLVINSQPSPNIAIIAAWGPTLGGFSVVARSALGEDTHGNILYAASMQALPVDLADALISTGATSAMELDINPQWVQLDISHLAGGPVYPAVPSQHRPAAQYLLGWSRDFVTVLATRQG